MRSITEPTALDAKADDHDTLSTADWIVEARAILIRDGVEAVKIDRIARECGVTRGGFYWRFKNRDELLDALLEDWRTSNTLPLLKALAGPGSMAERFERAARLWIDERDFDPRLDSAIRNWAQSSPKVAEEISKTDAVRIHAFRDFFLEAGYPADEALVRARIVYFHQIGYYTLQMKEELGERQRLSQTYFKILTGFDDFK